MTVDESQSEGALSYLKQVKTGAGGGVSVYDHLCAVLAKILEEKPQNAIDLLETSFLVKRMQEESDQPSYLIPPDSASGAAQAVQQLALFGVPEPPIDPETGEPVEAEAANEFECEDVLADARLFDAVGVGLGLSEMYEVMLAVKRLGEDPTKNVERVRFFGKVLGLYADYYVFETRLKEYPEEEEEQLGEGDVPMEKQTGANGYTYFVCNHLGGPFRQLPDIKPAQIKASRRIRRFFTGNLDSLVSTYPPFHGNEANYLRAQIARIVATTILCPANYFIAGEEGLEKNEEYESPAPRELGALSGWCHRYPHLKTQGRCELFVREPPEGEEEEFQPTEEEQEEGPEPLASVEADTEVNGSVSWTPLFSSSTETVKFQVAGIRSNLWPGAFSVGTGAHFSNIYVGWGLKNQPYLPPPPPPIAQEYSAMPMESVELPPKPVPEGEGEEGAEE